MRRIWILTCVLALLVTVVASGDLTYAKGDPPVNYRVRVFAGLRDNQSAIADATVSIEGTSHLLLTDTNGETPTVSVPSGVYTIRVTAKGWRPLEMSNIQLQAVGDFQETYVFMTQGQGMRRIVDNNTPRSSPMTPGKPDGLPGSNRNLGDVTIQAVESFVAPSSINACETSSNCSYVNTETLVKMSLWREWGNATTNYNSGNWPQDALKAGAVAIRSWLYYNAKYQCKHSGCKVYNSEADLVWTNTCPGSCTKYDNAVSLTTKEYLYYGVYLGPGAYYQKPCDAMFADRVGDPSKDGSLNADGTNNGKDYLQSHTSPPDRWVESYRPAGYAPGLSQRGTKDWLVGFYDTSGNYYKLNSYVDVLKHDYNYYPGLDIAQ